MVGDPQLLFDGPTSTSTTGALAHGAGMESPFLAFLAKGPGERGYDGYAGH